MSNASCNNVKSMLHSVSTITHFVCSLYFYVKKRNPFHLISQPISQIRVIHVHVQTENLQTIGDLKLMMVPSLHK